MPSSKLTYCSLLLRNSKFDQHVFQLTLLEGKIPQIDVHVQLQVLTYLRIFNLSHIEK